MQVLVCGGGTGGHIYPALSVVARLRQIGLADEHFLWIGTRGEMEETLVPRANIELQTITGGPIVGVSLPAMAANVARLTWSLGDVTRLFRRFRPDVLLMTGGYVNAPVGLVAWLRRVPSAIFLPDVEPGSAIKALSRVVDRVACTTGASRQYLPAEKVVVTGYPVRPALRAATEMSQEAARQHFALAPDRPTLLVFGGSRGARSINRALIAILPELLEAGIQVIHVSGVRDWPEIEGAAGQLPAALRDNYRPVAYLHERMGAAMRSADLVVARAGAGMLGEAPAFGLPSVLVPYPHAWRYQRVNARYLEERGAAVRLDDERLSQDLLPTVLSLIKDGARLQSMSEAARALDAPDAAGNLARLLKDLGQKGKRS